MDRLRSMATLNPLPIFPGHILRHVVCDEPRGNDLVFRLYSGCVGDDHCRYGDGCADEYDWDLHRGSAKMRDDAS